MHIHIFNLFSKLSQPCGERNPLHLEFGQTYRDISHTLYHHYLAGEPRIISPVGPQSQHRRFLRVGRRQISRNLDEAVTSATYGAAPAISVNTGDVMFERCLHERQARITVDHTLRPVMLNKGDYRHKLLFPCFVAEVALGTADGAMAAGYHRGC
jgi:hypothetical protein